jgi:hypothetical protein
MSYTAIDAFNRGQLKATAKILYKQIYTNFAKSVSCLHTTSS